MPCARPRRATAAAALRPRHRRATYPRRMKARATYSRRMRGLASLAAEACVVIALTGCSSAAVPAPTGSASATRPATASPLPTGAPTTPATTPPRPLTTPSSRTTAAHGRPPVAYRPRVLHHGGDHPGDLVPDRAGSLLYSDYTNGTISRLNSEGTRAVLHRGIDGPEGMALLADGTLVVAEENTNRLLAFAP